MIVANVRTGTNIASTILLSTTVRKSPKIIREARSEGPYFDFFCLPPPLMMRRGSRRRQKRRRSLIVADAICIDAETKKMTMNRNLIYSKSFSY
jgi:hypothetical protein